MKTFDADKADKEIEKVIKVLKNNRKNKGISHELLAEYTGLSRTAISTTESGKSSPTLRTVLRMCKAMDVKLSDILKQLGH